MSNSVGSIGLDLGLNYKQFDRQLQGIAGTATNKVGGAFKKLGALVGGAFAVKKLFDFGQAAVGLASDLEEVQNVVDVTFGSMANQVNDFAKTALEAFGLSELSAKKFTSTVGAMLKSSGITGQTVTDMSIGITQLAADMASFYNLSGEDAFDKIRSGLAGQTEPLKQLGVNLSVANLEAYALSTGIKKAYQSMSQAEQTLLRYNYLLSVTADAQGDFARNGDSWANTLKVMSERWKSFQATMGQGFINMLTPVLRGINTLILKLQQAAQYFKAFTELIFGATKTGNGAASATQDISAGLGGVSKEAKGASKALKGVLGGFDQLNVLGEGAGGGLEDASAGLGSFEGFGAIETGEPVLPDISGMLDGMLAGFDFQPLIDSFNRFKQSLAPFTQGLFEGLAWFKDNILVPLAQWTVNDLVPAFFDALAGALDFLNPLIEELKPLGQWLWADFLQPMAAWTGGAIVVTLQEIGKALSTIGEWVSTNKVDIQTGAVAVGAFFLAWKLDNLTAFLGITPAVIKAFFGLAGAIGASTLAKVVDKWETLIIMGLYAKDFVLSIGKAIGALVVSAAQWVINTGAIVANQVAMGLSIGAQWLMTAATTAWNVVCAIAAGVTTAFGAAVAFLTSPIGLVILAVAALIAGIVLLVKNWDKVKETAANVWKGIKDIWGKVSDWMNDNVVKPVGNMFIGLWNKIIDGMNFLIRGWNLIKFDMPDWVPLIGGKTFGINIPTISKIPALANGGMVSAPTLAMVGDNKNANIDPEVVSPLSTLQDMLSSSNQAVVEVLIMILKALESLDLTLDIDGERLSRIVRDYMRREDNRVGRSTIMIGGMPV